MIGGGLPRFACLRSLSRGTLWPVRAIAKLRPEAGFDFVEVPEPSVRTGHVKLRVEAASACGTDLHIIGWDTWAAGRIHPPRIIGHEFCGTIVEVGEGVTDRKVGDFVSSESHIVCGECRQCREGQAHVCVNTRILGVDVDGGFAPFAVIPAENARPTDPSVPCEIAAFQDALGNAVHTVSAGVVKDQVILITGMGPIGLCAVAVAKALGAAKVIAVEPSEFRTELAYQMGADEVRRPGAGLAAALRQDFPGGFDATLEMSGHPASLALAVDATRPGGRVSLLGVYGQSPLPVDFNEVIFKGLTVQGIVGRHLWQTWDLMHDLLSSGRLDVRPVITHRMPYTEFGAGVESMRSGQAGKVVFSF